MSLFEQKSLLAKLMATEDMLIRQANVPTASFDIKNRVLTVPILDKNLSNELYDLFMGHETGHALWTPLDGMIKAKESKINMSVLNVVEDSRIERKIKTKYPGIKPSFVKAYKELFDKNFFETEGKDVSEYNLIDRINLHCKIGASLALPFTEDEKKLLEEVDSTESFDDVIEVTKKLCELMKEQLQEIEQPKPLKVKILVDNTENSDGETETPAGDEEGDEEADIIIDARSESEEKPEEKSPVKSEAAQSNTGDSGNDSNESEEAGSGASRSGKNAENEIRSLTDDAYRRNESNLFSKDRDVFIYVNIPKYDTKRVMDYKKTISCMKDEMYEFNTKAFNSYRHEAAKVVSYLVKEFELRKNADQMKRAQSAKTGDLNMNRLYSYNFTDDIFKKITVMPQGKSHGLVMFIDWSGSMVRHLANTVKQLLNLAMFCKKVNIPFEVYCFNEGTLHEHTYAPNFKKDDLHFNKFGLINLLSSRMNANEFTYMASALMKISAAGEQYSRVRPPPFLGMSGTPLNEAIIASMEIVPEFQKNNRLQIVNTVFLTDGEGSTLARSADGEGYAKTKPFSHMVIHDPKTREEQVFERNGYFSAMYQTDCLLRLLKARTKSHVIGFFVGEVKDVTNRIDYFFPEATTMESGARNNFIDKIRDNFRKESSMVVTSTGFDDYYILRSNGLDTDDDEELTFRENATTRGMVTAFSKYAGNKISSRVILNRFIGLIT